MKRIIAMILVIIMTLHLTACGQNDSIDLMQDVPAKALDVQPDMDAGAGAAADFGVRLFQTATEDGKNTLISPLSVLYALAMTANGADGETLDQMEQVLGMDAENLNSFMLAYMALLPNDKAYKMSLANSIWFKDDPAFTVENSFLRTNADYYGAGVYKAPFDDGTRNDINNWVKDHTDGMIPEIIDEIPSDAIMYLVNALAFEAEWDEIYREPQIREGSFFTEDGSRQTVEMMYAEEHTYIEDEMATGFLKYYKDRRYAFVALLPKEGVSVDAYVSGLTGDHLRALLSEAQNVTVNTVLPKFETECDLELSDVLVEMGMADAFQPDSADFSRLGTYQKEGMNIFISRVLHKTFISVGEQGTKAGAATAVEMSPGSAAPVEEVKKVILDRPFVYMLIDCETNLPFFIGTMMNVEGN